MMIPVVSIHHAREVSTIFFFELYRMNMPIFAPSLRLLVVWIRQHGIMWERFYGKPLPVRSGAKEMPSP